MAENGQQTDDVYDRVRNAILEGTLAPGSVMSQVALAEELGISRTPLREALRMLQSEGLVEGEPNRRVRVAPMTAQDLEELCIMRIALESEALRLSVPKMTSEDLARLEGHMAEMSHFAQDKDYVRWTVPHHSFHRAPLRIGWKSTSSDALSRHTGCDAPVADASSPGSGTGRLSRIWERSRISRPSP